MPQSETSILNAFLPGYSFFSRLFSFYFNADISLYFLLIAVAIGNSPRLRDIVKRLLTSTLEIKYNDEAYRFILFWMTTQSFSERVPHIIANTESRKDFAWYKSEEDDDDSHINETDLQEDMDFDYYWLQTIRNDKSKKPHYTPGAGTHYFQYEGHWISLTRTPYPTDTSAPWLMNAENITLSCFGRNPKILKKILEEARHSFFKRKDDRIVTYSGLKAGDNFQWVQNEPTTPRPFPTVVLDRKEKRRLLEDIMEYLHPRTRFWYHTRGIPYQRGYLFSGPPGTGKTSLVLAVASLLHLDVYLLNLEELTEKGLLNLFRKLPRRCILLFEDIDCVCVSHNRRDSPTASGQQKDHRSYTKNHGLSLSALLNAIDGVAAPEGRLLMMTTNHPEKLDPALTRPGRIDTKVVFHYANTAVTRELFRSMYTASNGSTGRASLSGTCATLMEPNSDESDRSDNGDNDEITAFATEFAHHVPEDKFTAAEIQGYLLQHKKSPENAVKGIDTWVKERINEGEIANDTYLQPREN